VAFLASYALMPIVDIIEDMGVKRWGAILIVYLFIGLALATFMALFLPTLYAELRSIQENFDGYAGTVREVGAGWEQAWARRFGSPGTLDIGEEISKWGSTLGNYLLRRVPAFISNVLSVAMFAIIVPLATFFLLKDTRRAKKAIIGRVPNRFFEMTVSLVWRINQQLGSYIQGELLTILIVGSASVVGLRLIGLKYYAVLGVGTGIVNIIPYVGPLIALVVSLLVALVTSGSGQLMALVVLVCLAVQLIDNVTKPFIVARSVSMHPLTVMFFVLVGGQIFGALGMILAVPVVSIVKVTVWTIYEEFQKRSMLLQGE
jgi:predicted PurR-regulated permease PerM